MFFLFFFFFFFFQAEDGIRDWSVTGVQTCALPISFFRAFPEYWDRRIAWPAAGAGLLHPGRTLLRSCIVRLPWQNVSHLHTRKIPKSSGPWRKIGRASCRERSGEDVDRQVMAHTIK